MTSTPSIINPPLYKRIILWMILIALLATPTMVRLSAKTPMAAVGTYGFVLTEVAKQSGINFQHTAPKFDSKLDHIMPQIAVMGAAVSIADFDRDGLDDLYFCNSGEGSLNALYRNNGDGTFNDVAGEMGVADLNRLPDGSSMGSVWGDFNNDGFEDLFIYRWGKPVVFRNEGGKKFTQVVDAGLPKWLNANSAVWLDYDRDGHLDLFIANYYSEDLNLWKLADTKIMPESFEYASNGGRKYLLRNNGNGTFTDVAQQVGITSTRWTLAAASSDLNGDNWPDIFLANDYGVAELFLNDGGKGFREVGKPAGVGESPKSGMNATFGDVMNTGELAIYRSNISEPGYLLQGNDLWIPAGKDGGGVPQFMEMGHTMGVSVGGWAWGSQFGDFNNDGRQDLYLTNGYISAGDKQYWYDFSKITGANKSIIIDAANWPAMNGRSLAGYQQKRLWVNQADRFIEVAQSVGATDTYDGRAVALADLFSRGSLDIVIATQKGPALVYKNEPAPDHKWIGFDLQATRSNRSAIGTQVTVSWNGQKQLQEVNGGTGFCSQNSRRLHFGLGKDPMIEKVRIRWPSGAEQTLTDLDLNKRHTITEPAESTAGAS